jgi:glycerol-3-phosphate acyltransferase PlsY
MTLYVVYIVAAYLVGSIPIGLILSKLKGKDPRKIGSGNIGATNVMRAVGKTIGIITLLGDITKGFVPTILAVYYEEPKIVITAIGIASFLGHLYPVFLKFKGGKGVATALGVYLAVSPLAILINAIIFILVLLKWRYVSLGSLVGTGLIPLTFFVLRIPQAYIYLSFIIGVLIFIKHRDNIKRLLEGKENKISV